MELRWLEENGEKRLQYRGPMMDAYANPIRDKNGEVKYCDFIDVPTVQAEKKEGFTWGKWNKFLKSIGMNDREFCSMILEIGTPRPKE